MLRFRALLCAVVLLGICRIIPAQTIEVIEKATRLVLREGADQLIFAVRNPLQKTIQAHVRVELLDDRGKIQGKTEQQENISSGESRIVIPFSEWSHATATQDRDTLWDRLRYSFEFEDKKLSPVSGIVAIGEITPQLFELKTWRPRDLVDDSTYRIRVSTQHPLTRRPAGGVAVEAKLQLHDSLDSVLHANAVTDKNGNAMLSFSVPENQRGDSPS